MVGGVTWGIVFSKSSALNRVENVRLASSAIADVRQTGFEPVAYLSTHFVENEAHHEVCASSAEESRVNHPHEGD